MKYSNICESCVDNLIRSTMKHFSVPDKYFAEIKAACVEDYADYDINDITLLQIKNLGVKS